MNRKFLPGVGCGAALAVAWSLSACAADPDLPKPAAITSQHYDAAAEQALGVRLGDAAKADWWRVLRSPKLDAVMRQALDGNLDLAAADATLAQAAEGVVASRGALRPQVDLVGSAGRARAANGAVATQDFYAIGPQISFDPDLFGGLHRRVDETVAIADAQKHQTGATYLILTGDVATQAIALASARAQIVAVQTLLADDHRTLDLVRAGHRYGAATEADVAQASARLAQDETLLPPLEQQADTARHTLSVLSGKGPGDWAAPDFDLCDFALPADLPVSLPSALARSRPDIQVAEARVRAAGAAVGVATADLYPRLQLTASVADAGPGVGALWNLAAGLAGPIYRGGTLKAQRRAARDGYDAALAGYRQTVIRALGQVADALQAVNHDGAEHAAQAQALAAAEASLTLNREGYRAGEVDLLQVLDSQQAYQRALLGEIRARTAQHLDTVRLSVALGGDAGAAFERRAAARDRH